MILLLLFYLNFLDCFGNKDILEVKKYAQIPEGLKIETINQYDETGKQIFSRF